MESESDSDDDYLNEAPLLLGGEESAFSDGNEADEDDVGDEGSSSSEDEWEKEESREEVEPRGRPRGGAKKTMGDSSYKVWQSNTLSKQYFIAKKGIVSTWWN